MSLVTPVVESEAADKVAQTFQRIKDLLGVDQVPEPFLLYARVPSLLQDFFMNGKRFVFADGKLTVKQKSLLAFVVAATQSCGPWASFFRERCRTLGWSDEEMVDALAVASTCAMYNTFFKFRDLAGRDAFQGLSVGLRAHTFSGTSLDDPTVELVNIVISDANSCHACVSGHVSKALELGLDDESILEAVQCAATMTSGIAFLNAAGPANTP